MAISDLINDESGEAQAAERKLGEIEFSVAGIRFDISDLSTLFGVLVSSATLALLVKRQI
jgi:hypothetical protein